MPGGLGNVARAFAHRNYRIYVIGNSISLIGWWLERVAVGWLTWTLTHSGAWLGLIALADFLPVLFLAPFAGVLADRRDRVWTIRITQWIGCAQASLLAILVVSDAMTIEILFALVLMLGIASGVAQPSRLALIPTLVGRESLASALAINSVVFNLARFIGPAMAGIVIAELGIAAAFAANAVSHIAFQISLLNLRELPPQPAVGRQNVLRLVGGIHLYLPACRDRTHVAALCRDDDRHARLYRAISGLRRPGLRPRATGPGDFDLDCRPRRDLWRQLDGATLGDHRPRHCRAGLHPDYGAGGTRLYRNRHVLHRPALRLCRRRDDDDHRHRRPDANPGGGRGPHERPGHGALRYDLSRRPGGRRRIDGNPERISRVASRTGARRDCVGRVLAGDAVPAQAHGGRARGPTYHCDRRPCMIAGLKKVDLLRGLF